MCGIIGVLNSKKDVSSGLKTISYRGLDASKKLTFKNGSFAHCLHAMQDFVVQPLKKKSNYFMCNSEIYNVKELNEKHGLKAKNDTELIFEFLNKGLNLNELDGVYAFSYKTSEKLVLQRDIIGVKPLWFYFDDKTKEIGFASEKKALIKIGFEKNKIQELNPRKTFIFDLKTNKLKLKTRPFFKTIPINDDKNKIKTKLKNLLTSAIKKRTTTQKTGLLLSGGVDSSFIALKLKQLNIPFKCFVAGLDHPSFKESEDVLMAKKLAKRLDLDLEVVKIKLDKVPKVLKKILPLIEDNNVVKAGVALPFYLCAKEAQRKGVKLLISGLGSEEIFAGYKRHENSQDINKECLAGLRKIYERDLYRDDVITMANNIELRLPFLDKELVKYSLKIPGEYKIATHSKQIFREVALEEGLLEEFSFRKKKAAQYGSNFDKAIAKLAKKENKSKSEYLKQFFNEGNVKIAALMSTGKDSALATQIMLDQNYDVACFITVISSNKDSYMYHGPNTWLANKISKTSNIPLITVKTLGQKEKELVALKQAIKEAIFEFKIEGIVTGALFSNYQRDRIEKICEELGIKCFSPLWHMDQEKEIELLLQKKFKFCMVKIAAYGLDKSWLGKEITKKELERLKELNKKIGFNVAGEGGEYESLILKAPFMKKEIQIKKYKIYEENEYTATMLIDEVELK